jgi:polyisoprenoid-binding protein YceI
MSSYTNLKDPDETSDFGLDLSEWLEDGDTLAGASWSVDAGMTEVSEAIDTDNAHSAVMVSGGTVGTVYTLKGTMTTSEGRVMVRRIRVYCVER